LSTSSRGQLPWIGIREREQEKRREAERKEGDQWGTSSKVKLARDTRTIIAMASSLAKKAGDASIVGSHRTCSNGRCGKGKCDNGETPIARGRVSSKEPICYGCG